MQTPALFNLFAHINSASETEEFSELLRRPGLRLERIVSHGQATPPDEWYDQAWDEWVILLSGAAKLEFADGLVRDLQVGDYVLLPAHCRHRVAWTAPQQATVWLALHMENSMNHHSRERLT